MEYVVLVDEQDNEIGSMEKLQTHVEGRLHRAISVFIFNTKGELLLQQRTAGKYHSGLLWTNTCCSHPRPGEHVREAAARRLHEEMGIYCPLEEAFSFVYKADVADGLTEYEYDHVFTGITDDIPYPNDAEVADWNYVNRNELQTDMDKAPEQYTAWFKICMDKWQELLFMKNENA